MDDSNMPYGGVSAEGLGYEGRRAKKPMRKLPASKSEEVLSFGTQ